ncbi:MAG: hypothetical protein JWL86_2225 [Rhizobium sp.]|nr:hypothetical protein [Rhizobium sp.]
MIENEQAARPVEPRYFWRRLFAIWVDILVAQLIVGIPLMIIMSGLSLGPVMPNMSECRPFQDDDLARRAAIVLKSNPTDTVKLLGCKPASDGSTTVIATSFPKGRGFPNMEILRVAKGGQIEPQASFKTQALIGPAMSLLLPAVIAIFTAYGRQSLGRKITGLKVVLVQGGFPDYRTSALREYLVLLPSMVIVVVFLFIVLFRDARQTAGAFFNAVAEGDVSQLPLEAYAGAAGYLFFLIWGVINFFPWHGQTIYDRILGTEVVKVR